MAALSEALYHFLTMTIIFFTLLLLEVIDLIRSVTGNKKKSNKPTNIITTKYLELVEEKIPTIYYGENLRQESNECAVCLSEFSEGESVRKFICKHTFHKDCIDKWLQQCFATCPICRTEVLPVEIVAHYHWLQNQTENDISYGENMFLLSSAHGRGLSSIHGHDLRRFI